jgi:hypothetical protein
MPAEITRLYDEARDARGPLDEGERAAAITICAYARSKREAVLLLTMCNLLRKGGT